MRKGAALLVIFTLLLGLYVLSMLIDAGAFRETANRPFGICEKVGPIPGPEDMAKIGENIIISSDSRDEKQQGSLYLYQPPTRELAKIATPQGLEAFHPHGIDVFHDQGRVLVYVINHPVHDQTQIEVFEWKGELTHIKTIKHALFQSGNDLAVVGRDKFYLTSDFGTPNKFLQKLIQYSRQKTGYVSYFDGVHAKKTAENLFYANGIVRTEKNGLAVAAMLERAIHIGNSQTIELEGAPDNLTLADGKIVAALHPNLFALKAELGDRSKKAPSKIVAIRGSDVETIYENDGTEISSASVALFLRDDRLLIGSVFDNHFLDCTKN